MENDRNTPCPYCQRPIRQDEHAVRCAECGVGHHEICWVKNSGCTTRGCNGMPEQPVRRNIGTTPERLFDISRQSREPQIVRSGMNLERLFGVCYSDEAAGKLCPYCQTTIKEGEQATICGKCSIPHHGECWQHNGGCTTYGCVPTITRPLNSRGVQGPTNLSNIKYEPDPDLIMASWIVGSGAVGFIAGLVGLFFNGGFIGVVIATTLGCIAGAALNAVFGSGKD